MSVVADEAHSGIVNENVNASKRGNGFLNRVVNGDAVRDINSERGGAFKFGGDAFAGIRIKFPDRDPGAALGEHRAYVGPNSAAAPGDDHAEGPVRHVGLRSLVVRHAGLQWRPYATGALR